MRSHRRSSQRHGRATNMAEGRCTLFLLLFCLPMVPTACAADRAELAVAPIELGALSHEENQTFLVLSSEDEFAAVYQAIHSGRIPSKQPPSVDFENSFVLVAFMGLRTSTGYAISFAEGAVISDGVAHVIAIQDSPPPGAIVGTAMTSPYAMAQIGRGDFGALVFLDEDREVLHRVATFGAGSR